LSNAEKNYEDTKNLLEQYEVNASQKKDQDVNEVIKSSTPYQVYFIKFICGILFIFTVSVLVKFIINIRGKSKKSKNKRYKLLLFVGLFCGILILYYTIRYIIIA
jgi:H+/Cl- antiporter ClcA